MLFETWRPVVGFEGVYEVSDIGRVRSVDRVDTSGKRRRGRILSTCVPERYRAVDLFHGGSKTRRKIHRLVCEAFHGPAPEGKPRVLHADDDRFNNQAGNLRWGDDLENAQDRARNRAA